MRYEIEIQQHAQVATFIGHNDMIEKTAEEKEAALSLYKTKKWEQTLNGITVVYVVAFDLDDNLLGGIVWVDDEKRDYTHALHQHEAILQSYF